MKEKKPKKPRISESTIAKYLVDYFAIYGLEIIRMPLGGVLMNVNGKQFMRKNPLAGFFDYMVPLGDGRFAFIETKASKGGKISDDQIKWRDKYIKWGCDQFIVSSIEDVHEVFCTLISKVKGSKYFCCLPGMIAKYVD